MVPPFEGEGLAAVPVPRRLLEGLDFGVAEVVDRGVPDVLEALGRGLAFGVGDELGLGFGVGDGLGLGALAAAGGAVRGAPPDPKANPITVPGAGS